MGVGERPSLGKETNVSVTTKSRPLSQLCACGRPCIQYVTSKGWKSAPYCAECAKREQQR